MPSVFRSTENPFRGVRVMSDDLPKDASQFEADLSYSISVWQAEGIKVIWLCVSEEMSHLLPEAFKAGFVLHHVSHIEQRQIVLTKRLVDGATIPEFAHHTVGVGGIVLNDRQEVLTIVEKHDMVNRPEHFKFPGGAVDSRELLQQAVIREVREETNIRAAFNGIVGFRHYHRGQFGTSNLYFVCHLTAVSDDVLACPNEIGLAQWMSTEAYLSKTGVLDFNKSMLEAALSKKYLDTMSFGDFLGLEPEEYEVFIS